MGKKRPTAMEGGERERSHAHPHRSGSSGGVAGDFFVCFTARPSSSSAASAMRVPSSKGLLSPGRGREASSAPALSGSLSRRLRKSGSVKGGQSPMFPSGVHLTGRKKGCAFEAAEPSSPKVTCIGQVRVKAKKKGRSKARSGVARSQRGRGGEASFRREEGGEECISGRNQGWVCEALRTIGSEFNCFLPCGGWSLCGGGCSSSPSSGSGEEKRGGKKVMARSSSSSSCGALFARWLMAVQESEVEMNDGDVVEESEKVEVGFLLVEREEKTADLRSVVGEKGEIVVEGKGGEDGNEEAARVGVCIPPKNALLLMRCRSDPVRMAALANRFWGSPAANTHSDEQLKEEDDEEDEEYVEKPLEETKKEGVEFVEVSVKSEELEKEEGGCCSEKTAEDLRKTLMEDGDGFSAEENLLPLKKELSTPSERLPCRSQPDIQIPPSKDEAREETFGIQRKQELEKKQKSRAETEELQLQELRRSKSSSSSKWRDKGRRRGKDRDLRRHSFSFERDTRRHSFSSEKEAGRASFSVDRGSCWSFSIDAEELGSKEEHNMIDVEKKRAVTPEAGESEDIKAIVETDGGKHNCGGEKQEAEHIVEQKNGEAVRRTGLPDCLLMMMYEPKLSMEVSKETWVCPDDFINWRLYQHHNRLPSKPGIAGEAVGYGKEAKQESAEVTSNVLVSGKSEELVAVVPSTPAMAAIQQKVVGPVKVAPYEPFSLTRCKSEPVRSSAKLDPDVCFLKDRHRPLGAAGIGF